MVLSFSEGLTFDEANGIEWHVFFFVFLRLAKMAFMKFAHMAGTIASDAVSARPQPYIY